jgi:hypothetical protein
VALNDADIPKDGHIASRSGCGFRNRRPKRILSQWLIWDFGSRFDEVVANSVPNTQPALPQAFTLKNARSRQT